jgi:hypothetical protein
MNALGANFKLQNRQTSNTNLEFGSWDLEFRFILHNSAFILPKKGEVI